MSYIGANKIGGMHLGSTTIAKAYLGSDLVYQKSGGQSTDGQLEYIESDGVAYINSNILGNYPMSSEITFVPVICPRYSFIAGCRIGSSATSGNFFFLAQVSNAEASVPYYARAAYGTTIFNGISVATSITNKTPVETKCSMNSSRGIYFAVKQQGESNWTEINGGTSSNVTTNLPIYIMAYNKNGSAGSIAVEGTRLCRCKLYGDATWTNLVFDGVPWRYNGEVGLWDNVSNTFFGNANSTGAFIGGQRVNA